MSKSNNRHWLETDGFFNSTGKNTEKSMKNKLPNVFLYTNSPLRTTTPTLSRLDFFPQKITLCQKPFQMPTTRYTDLFVTYREGFQRILETKT